MAQKVQIAVVETIPRYGCVTSSGELADSNNPAHQDNVIGVADGQIQYTAGPPPRGWGEVTIGGSIYEQSWTWTPGGAIYLNTTVLSQTPPGIGFTQQVGWALNAQTMLVNIR